MVHDVTKKNHTELIERETRPVIIKVYAPWCGPCVQMKPIFEKIAEELKASYVFAQLNVDEERDLAIKYGITSIPCCLFINHNNIVAHEVGYLNRADLLAKINHYFGKSA